MRLMLVIDIVKGGEKLRVFLSLQAMGKQHSRGMDGIHRKLRSSPDVYDFLLILCLLLGDGLPFRFVGGKMK